MNRAKAFFYVCAGLFLLALSYHLGVQNATAQTSPTAEAVGVYGSYVSAVIDRQLYEMSDGVLVAQSTPIPAVGHVIGCGGDRIVFENGEIYRWAESSWLLVGSLPPGGSVSIRAHSLSQLKARFRDAAPVIR